MARIIGITGFKGAGKDTFAGMLAKQYPNAVLDSFAAPIRDFVRTHFGYTEENKEDPIPWLHGCKTPRYLMQTLGTEWGRDMVHPLLWTTLLMRRIAAADKDVVVLITDVRFDNEAELIERQGGVVVRVSRPGLASAEHRSEKGVSSQYIEYCVHNASTFEYLENQAELIATDLKRFDSWGVPQ